MSGIQEGEPSTSDGARSTMTEASSSLRDSYPRLRSTPEQREDAIKRMSKGETAEKIAADLGFDPRTVSRWWALHQREQIEGEKQERARPVKTTPEEDQALIEVVEDYEEISLKRAMQLSGFSASEATARKRLKAAGLKITQPRVRICRKSSSEEDDS